MQTFLQKPQETKDCMCNYCLIARKKGYDQKGSSNPTVAWPSWQVDTGFLQNVTKSTDPVPTQPSCQDNNDPITEWDNNYPIPEWDPLQPGTFFEGYTFDPSTPAPSKPGQYPLCPTCFGEIKPGGHKNVSNVPRPIVVALILCYNDHLLVFYAVTLHLE